MGEAPGKNEDIKNKQFVGESGQYLEGVLDDLGINMRRDCWLTNALICRPPNNATPTTEQIEYCSPNLRDTIEKYKPKVIIPLGGPAIRAVTLDEWLDPIESVSTWVGFQIPSQTYNSWICPNYHPSYVIREKSQKQKGGATELLFRSYLQKALLKKNRPFDTIPNYRSMVEIYLHPDGAAKALASFRHKKGPICFDFETMALKPYRKDYKQSVSHILTASVCYRGERTIAFFCTGKNKIELRKLLAASNPKIAHNIQFEDRWSKEELGVEVNNWVWDTMNNAHIIDNRKGITSLEFQAYVQLGQPTYSKTIGKLLDTKGSYETNRIKQADPYELLYYNGLDSLLGYMLAVKQRKALGWPPL